MSSQIQDNSTSLNTLITAEPTHFCEQLSEEEKKALFGIVLKYILTVASNGGALWRKWCSYETFIEGKEALDTMNNIIPTESNSLRFHDAINYQQTNSTLCDVIDYERHFGCTLQQIKENIGTCQNTINLKPCFKNAIDHAKQPMADKVKNLKI